MSVAGFPLAAAETRRRYRNTVRLMSAGNTNFSPLRPSLFHIFWPTGGNRSRFFFFPLPPSLTAALFVPLAVSQNQSLKTHFERSRVCVCVCALVLFITLNLFRCGFTGSFRLLIHSSEPSRRGGRG